MGLDNAYIIGLAKVIFPNKYSKQIAIKTWLPEFEIQDKEAKAYLIKWRHRAVGHIEAGLEETLVKEKFEPLLKGTTQQIVFRIVKQKPH